MNGVYFGNIHSFYDLNLILAPFTPAPAEPKLNFLEIPGRDGHLDLTETNGEVKFNSREFEFIFTVAPGDPLTFDERVSAVSNALNGLRCKITLDRDPDYYWEGRCAVSEYDQDKNIGQITVTATVDPYKLKQNETVVSVVLVPPEVQTVVLTNSRKPVVPTITCTGNCSVSLGPKRPSRSLEAGTHKIPAFRLVEGTTGFLVSGDCEITFTYQEGEL